MANPKQFEALKQGVEDWNKWRKERPTIEIDLSKSNLSYSDLSGADLSFVDLNEANLDGANLRSSDLKRTNLKRAVLSHADLRGAILIRTDLRGAVLNGANLRGAIRKETIFNDANFAHVTLGETVFASIDLSTAIGLKEVIHMFPSTIGIDTFQLSKGKIPVDFLRGCGLSDLQIEMAKLAAPDLNSRQVVDVTYRIHRIHQLYVGQSIRYYSCFISYNSKDEGFAIKLHDDLQNNDVRCWFAPEDMKIGDQIRATIDQQIRRRDKLLVILSENSVQSEWVGDEVEAALEEEKNSNRLVLFPIRLDEAVMNTRDDWAAKIKRRRHIGDFSSWKDEGSYQKAFERLLRDLKAESE